MVFPGNRQLSAPVKVVTKRNPEIAAINQVLPYSYDAGSLKCKMSEYTADLKDGYIKVGTWQVKMNVIVFGLVDGTKNTVTGYMYHAYKRLIRVFETIMVFCKAFEDNN
ncbi:unnamed protein product [Vicia faba]|uniref:Uncharacterized protein n=1 Tax=Vicia faba TaxID=3906 RepID=A0AAV1AMB2_VICFA|nr:unnamed protein product [Vicia faba]